MHIQTNFRATAAFPHAGVTGSDLLASMQPAAITLFDADAPIYHRQAPPADAGSDSLASCAEAGPFRFRRCWERIVELDPDLGRLAETIVDGTHPYGITESHLYSLLDGSTVPTIGMADALERALRLEPGALTQPVHEAEADDV